MKILFLFCVLGLFSKSLGYEWISTFIDVPLDHFNFRNMDTFKLRYLVNDALFKEGGPIFLYTGNEGNIEDFAKNTGFLFDIYRQFNALLVFAEHRYYGESLPFGNLSYSSPEHLGYLSSQQALADFVYLINHLQKRYAFGVDKNLPVIAFGGSYGGMLAAWIRMKYPYAVTGAIASSAPIWQFPGLNKSCSGFNDIIADVYVKHGSQHCKDTLTNAFDAIENIGQDDKGKLMLSKTFGLCKSITSDSDIDVLEGWIGTVVTNLVEVNYPYPSDFLADLPAWPVKEFCKKIDAVNYTTDLDLVKALGDAAQIYSNYSQTVECLDIFSTSTDIGDESGWGFQACTDMIQYMCATDDDIFGASPYNFTAYQEGCLRAYSVQPASEDVPIQEYGGLDLSGTSNIVFSNGALDPWSWGGVLTNQSDSVLAIVIPDAAHHLDLRGQSPWDTEGVKNARKFHIEQIEKWIKEYNSKN